MAAKGIGSSWWAAGMGTALKSDLHCSQNNAPSSFSNPQKGHFIMVSFTSKLVLTKATAGSALSRDED